MVVRTAYDLSTKKQLPNGRLSFILLSDLHACSYGKDNYKLIEQIKSCESKLILFAGDMITDSSKKGIRIALSLVKKLKELGYGIYYTPGNHEQRTFLKKPDIYAAFLADVQEYVTLIDNTSLEAFGIRLYGYDPDNSYYQKVYKTDEAFQNMKYCFDSELTEVRRNGTYTILLAHDPDYLSAYSMGGFDLVVSGHIHGGAVRIPCLGGMFSPRYRFFPKYDRGVFTEGDSTMVLSGGIGHHGIPFRMFNPPEVVEINITQNTQV